MKNIKTLFLTVFFLGVCSLKADVIIIEEPDLEGVEVGNALLAGTGCPRGSVSMHLNKQTKSLRIGFDAYAVEVGEGKNLDRKSCSLAIPMHLPPGLNVALVSVKYRGYTELSEGTDVRLLTETFFTGLEGKVEESFFTGPSADTFEVEHLTGINSLISSECKQDVILRVNSSLRAKANQCGASGYAEVDALKASGGLVYELKFTKCDLL